MNFIEFRKRFIEAGCVNTNQMVALYPDFALYISNRIYKPSYVSLHSALAFYGIIPEAVTQITAVSSLKTAEFQNDFGIYTYNKVWGYLFFGYELKPFGFKTILFAHPEKALLDLLYIYPFMILPKSLKT